MSTAISTHILGVATGLMPCHPLRADYDMDLSKYIGSSLRLRSKIRYVYGEAPLGGVKLRDSPLHLRKMTPSRDDIKIITLNDLQIAVIGSSGASLPVILEKRQPGVPYAMIVSFVELHGPETNPNAMLDVSAIAALVSDAAQTIGRQLENDPRAFYTIKDEDPFDPNSIFVHRFQWDWVKYRRFLPSRLRNPPAAPPITPESIFRTASGTTSTSDFNRANSSAYPYPYPYPGPWIHNQQSDYGQPVPPRRVLRDPTSSVTTMDGMTIEIECNPAFLERAAASNIPFFF